MLGAIIITTDQSRPMQRTALGWGADSDPLPWAMAEVLGKTPINRLAEMFREVCDVVSVIPTPAPKGNIGEGSRFSAETACVGNLTPAGCEAILIAKGGAYIELDIANMLQFHREQGLEATRAFAEDGPLDCWIVGPSVSYASLFAPQFCPRSGVYHSQAYANRLQSARDFRRLILDSFHSRCRLRPEGTEIKPGIWVCEGAQIERSARIVAPAFIGRNVEISDDCLITRGSNVERSSHIDFGTAVENSAILPNTYVGIGLDLSHSIVDGQNLFNLQHDVSLRITDPVVLRENATRSRERQAWADVESGMAVSSAELS